jgi:hypothetical protein
VLSALSTSTAAQGPAPGANPDDRLIVVTVTYAFSLPVKSNDVDSQRAAMEQSRTMLYLMTAKECDMLQATIAISCQLDRLNVQSNVARHGRPGEETINVSANAQFKVALKPKS